MQVFEASVLLNPPEADMHTQILETLHQYSDSLWADQRTAAEEVQYGLSILSILVNSTAFPIN